MGHTHVHGQRNANQAPLDATPDSRSFFACTRHLRRERRAACLVQRKKMRFKLSYIIITRGTDQRFLLAALHRSHRRSRYSARHRVNARERFHSSFQSRYTHIHRHTHTSFEKINRVRTGVRIVRYNKNGLKAAKGQVEINYVFDKNNK